MGLFSLHTQRAGTKWHVVKKAKTCKREWLPDRECQTKLGEVELAHVRSSLENATDVVHLLDMHFSKQQLSLQSLSKTSDSTCGCYLFSPNSF
jgi:hypothetical protein